MKMRFMSIAVSLLAVMVVMIGNVASAVESPVGVKHVILIGWDGYGSEYVNWDEVPNLKKMKENGAWSLKKRSVLPSVSAINWCTMLMGAGSEIHGYRNWGSVKPEIPSAVLTERGRFPDIFYLVHTQMPEAETAATYTWDACTAFIDSEKVTYKQWIDHKYDELTVKLIEFLGHNPVLSFTYYSEPDIIGHGKGWGTDEYHKTVQDLDKYLGDVLKFLEENDRMNDTLVIVTSDHGGHDKRHGTDTLVDMNTPIVFYGAGVKPGEISDVIVNYDTAATIAWVLGLEPPQAWRGQAIKSAFQVK
ncbi:MAG: alkaline phosphatase [Planctomycetia bacterium]|nr:alkaline phosphatase [Planctomycetia bacterium]